MTSLIDYFIDPVLRGPVLGSMFMCFAASFVGVIVFLQKRSLAGETLSHAAYPGVILGALLTDFLFQDAQDSILLTIGVLAGAFCFAYLGLFTLNWLCKDSFVKTDSALCFVLSAFFGLGITLASITQFTHTTIYKQALNYLLGQPVTMTDVHIKIYGFLSLTVLAIILLFFKQIRIFLFDPDFAKASGKVSRKLQPLLTFLIALSVVIGIRTTGVVLMSAMLIAPAVASRQFSNRLSRLFILAPLFGLLSAFLGNILSYELTKSLSVSDYGSKMVLPLGPMIVLVASGFAFLALLFAHQRGLIPRVYRAFTFRQKCTRENILKILKKEPSPSIERIQTRLGLSKFHCFWACFTLKRQHLINSALCLTKKGEEKANELIRLHRLWEVYLVNDVGVGIDRVHLNAEEMEHILTEEQEKELIRLLNDPEVDPHSQPIPPKRIL